MTDLYATIKRLCYQRGVSVSTMCDECGISRATMTRVRDGSTKYISAKNANKMADYLGVDVSVLTVLNNKELKRKESPLSLDDIYILLDDIRNKPEMQRLFHATRKATPAQITAVAETLEVMTKYNDKDNEQEQTGSASD